MTRWLVVHPSDEMYGADRVLLESVDSIGAQHVTACWLPTDVHYPHHRLCGELAGRGIPVQHRSLPVLRRAYLNGAGITRLAARGVAAALPARRAGRSVDAAYLNTSAVLPMAPLLRRTGLRVVLHVHEVWGPRERRLLAPLLRFCDTTIAVSQAVAAALPAPSHVLYNGFADLTELPGPAPVDGRLRVLLASRWSSWKGHQEFLRAWQQARRSDAHLTIVGAQPPSGEGVDVPAVVRDLGLGDSVSVLSERSDIGSLLATTHVVAVPSVKPDPLPTVAIEAARAGRAVLGSRGGGLPEIVQHGRTGWLVAPGDVGAWADALRGLDVTAAVQYGAAARELFGQRFSADRYQRDLRALLT